MLNLTSSKMQMVFFLSLIAISASILKQQLIPVLSIALAIFATVSADAMLVRLRSTQPFLLSAAIVSGLIIGLLSSPTLPWYNIILAAVLAILGKNFLRFNNRHIFNPAALGLFVSGFLFHQNISWWAVSFQTFRLDLTSVLLLLVLLSPGYVSMIRMKRYKITISFFVVYIFLLGLLQFFQHSLSVNGLFISTIADPTTLFFALVMLPEPRTTPNNPLPQFLFGAFVAVATLVVSLIPSISIPDPLITGLLLGNLVFFKFR